MIQRSSIALFLILISFAIRAQDGRYLDKEIQIEADNDAFTLNLFVDRYYSQGSFGKYRVVDTTGFRKKVRAIGVNHRIYTPDGVSLKNVHRFDRPYAGHLTVSGLLTYYDKNAMHEYILELGVMGPSAMAGPIQTGWHKFFGMTIPEGWEYQINDSPIINGYFNTSHLLLRAGSIQILGEGHLGFGTAFNYARPELMLRLGKFKDLDHSVQYGANLGHIRKKSQYTQETIIFAAYGPEYVAYNSTIEGNLIGPTSVHTETQKNLVHQFRVGAMFAWSTFDLSLIYYYRSIETVDTDDHKYVGIRMSWRF